MNKRKNRDFQRPRRPLSIDGVSPAKPSEHTGSIGFERLGKKPRSMQRKSLDNFERPDGFSASTVRSPSIAIPRRPQYDLPEDKRKHFVRFWKNKDHQERLDSYTKKARRKKRLKITATVFVLLFAMFGFLAAKGYINLNRILAGGGSAAALDENVDPSKLRIEGDGRINILLLGRGGLGHDGADLTDTMILVSIDPISKEAGMVSIPRDLWVAVPGEGSMKINSVFYTGKAEVLNNTSRRTSAVMKQANESGFKLTEKVVEDVLGIPVHYHAMVDFSGFKKAINTVGGIDINVPSSVYEYMYIDGRNYTLNVKPGPHHFQGFEALAYARSRHTSKRGDFDRAERQRLMIIALKDKILSLGTFSNPAKVSSLLDQLGSHVQTNFSRQDVGKFYALAQQIKSSNVRSIGLADAPNDFVTTENLDGLSVVIPTLGVNNYDLIHYYIRTALKDSFLKNEDAQVLVLNGTTRPGLAAEKAYELRSYGYKVGEVGDTPTNGYAKTVVIDMGHGDKKYTRHYLEKRFKVVSTNVLPDASIKTNSADFVIILGNDISSG